MSDQTPRRRRSDLARRERRRILVAIVAAAYLFVSLAVGFSIDRESVLVWVLLFVLAASAGGPPGTLRRIVRDWGPFLVLYLVYDYGRGVGDTLGMPIRTDLPIEADRALFGGTVPTVWLQERLAPFDGTRWWEPVASIVYFSHFIVPWVVAAWLWVRDRDDWLRWFNRFATLSLFGVITFILLPVRPPWMAGEMGVLPELERSVTFGWQHLGLGIAESMVEKGRGAVNPVAAVPSLHAGYAALAAAYFFSRVGIVGRIGLAVYAVFMAFTLVYSGEHYVFDILTAWLAVAVTMLVWSGIERRRNGESGPAGQGKMSSIRARVSSSS